MAATHFHEYSATNFAHILATNFTKYHEFMERNFYKVYIKKLVNELNVEKGSIKLT